MTKKWILVSIMTAMIFGISTVSMAKETEHTTAGGLKSKGVIVYQKGQDSVVIDSADLYRLADKIDSFKKAVVEQLAVMHTFLTTGGGGISLGTEENIGVVHVKPSDAVDPLSVGFDTILAQVAASQSVPLEIFEDGYEEGVKLYRTQDGKLTTDASVQEIQEIPVAAALADNLSAGCAAWVDGNLLLGTGADNQAYYRLGYTVGYAQKQPANGTIQYHYHVHKDGAGNTVSVNQVNGANPGGCYGGAGHNHTESCPQGDCRVDTECYSSSKGESGLYHNQYHHRHRNCGLGTVDGSSWSKTKGEDYTDTHKYYTCGDKPVNIWSIQCKKTSSTIESAQIVYH